MVWRKVDIDSDTQCAECKENTKRNSHSSTRTIDCGDTSRGLFLGILVLVAALGTLIAFFMLTTKDYYDERATLVTHIYHIALYLAMTVISVVVLLKLRTLDHNACRSTTLEDILVVICLLAVLSYDLCGILSGILNMTTMAGLLVLASSSAELIQSIVQMAAIVMGVKLCTPDGREPMEQMSKPGRECVTFLVVANISLWVLSVFSNIITQGYIVQISLVGQLPWSHIISIVNPVVMFYHLFSASCLTDIWYNAYRIQSAQVAHI